MSAPVFYRLRAQAQSPYGRALCTAMIEFFRARTPSARAEILWAFAKEHGDAQGHDIEQWSKLIRFVEQEPMPGGPRRIEAEEQETAKGRAA